MAIVPAPVSDLYVADARGSAPALRAAFLGGCRAMLPWLAGVVPFGLTIGVTVAGSSLDPVAGWLTAPLIFAGSAQLLALVVPLYLIAEVVRTLATRPAVVAAVVGALAGLAGMSLPFQS